MDGGGFSLPADEANWPKCVASKNLTSLLTGEGEPLSHFLSRDRMWSTHANRDRLYVRSPLFFRLGIDCREPPLAPEGGTRRYTALEYGSEARYTCGPHAAFVQYTQG